jgi:hypothetical protein
VGWEGISLAAPRLERSRERGQTVTPFHRT